MKASSRRKPAARPAAATKSATKGAAKSSTNAATNGAPQKAAKPAARPRMAEPPATGQAAPASAASPETAAAPQPIAVSAAPRRAGLKLEPSCTLRDALDMQFQLLATDFGDSDVLLDGSAVDRIDTAGLQMLVAFAKYHATSGKRLQWIAASPELQRGSRLLGLDEALGLIPSPPEVSGGH